MFKSNSQQGFTLIEILISSLLISFILTSIFTLYLMFQHIYALQFNNYEIEDNARFLTSYLNQQIQQVADSKCMINNKSFILGFDYAHLPQALRKQHVFKDSVILMLQNCGNNQQTYLYIADTLRTDNHNKHILGLYKKMISNDVNQTLELAENINDMQINLGLTDHLKQNIVEYISLSQLTPENWKNVNVIEINLTLCSFNNELCKPLNLYSTLRKSNAN